MAFSYSSTVNSAAQRLRRETAELQEHILVSIEAWKKCRDYRDLQAKLGQGLALEKYIIPLQFEELVAKLQSGEISAYAALKSYQIRESIQSIFRNLF